MIIYQAYWGLRPRSHNVSYVTKLYVDRVGGYAVRGNIKGRRKILWKSRQKPLEPTLNTIQHIVLFSCFDKSAKFLRQIFDNDLNLPSCFVIQLSEFFQALELCIDYVSDSRETEFLCSFLHFSKIVSFLLFINFNENLGGKLRKISRLRTSVTFCSHSQQPDSSQSEMHFINIRVDSKYYVYIIKY